MMLLLGTNRASVPRTSRSRAVHQANRQPNGTTGGHATQSERRLHRPPRPLLSEIFYFYIYFLWMIPRNPFEVTKPYLFALRLERLFCHRAKQIDGRFLLQGETYLVESKWHSELTGASDLLAFHRKLEQKAASVTRFACEQQRLHRGRDSSLRASVSIFWRDLACSTCWTDTQDEPSAASSDSQAAAFFISLRTSAAVGRGSDGSRSKQAT